MPEPDKGYRHTDTTAGNGWVEPDTDQLPPPPADFTKMQADCWTYLSTRSYTIFANWDISKRRGKVAASKWLADHISEVQKVAKIRTKAIAERDRQLKAATRAAHARKATRKINKAANSEVDSDGA